MSDQRGNGSRYRWPGDDFAPDPPWNPRVAPGKVTLTSRIPGPGAVVQRKSAGGAVVQKQDGQTGEPEASPAVDVDAIIGTLQFTAATIAVADNVLQMADALTWVENVRQRLSAAVEAYASLPADHADRARLGAAIVSASGQASALMTTLANDIRSNVETLLENSSPVEETAATADTPAQQPAQPTLPATADVDRLRDAAAGLSRTAQDGTGALDEASKTTLSTASGAVADAALSIYQGQAVLSARADWRTGYAQDTLATGDAADANQASSALRRKQGARDGLNSVFADSGFNRYGVQADATAGGWEPADWCGMFVVTHLFRASMDGELRAGFWETSNVNDFFNYTQIANASRIPVTVWVAEENQWMELRAYHQMRGSERTWTDRAAINAAITAGNSPFRSGDACLINHTGGDTAQHIVMVDSYDSATGALRTIEGNTLGIHSDDDGRIERNDEGSFERDTGNTSVGIHIREMNGDLGADRPGSGAYQNRAGNTVLGCGRMSVVDFEDHRYSTMPIGEFPEAALHMSPEAMTQAQRGANEVATSRDRGGS